MKKFLTIVGAIIVSVLILVGGCSALVAGSVDTGNGPVEVESHGSKAKGGTADDLGGFQIVGKVEPKRDPLGDFTGSLRVKNTAEETSPAAFTVTVLKGKQIVASLDCGDYRDVAPGRETSLDCLSTDKFRPGWDSIEVEYAGW